MKKNNQKGTSLLLTILIMAALLTIALVISRIGLQEIKLTQDISKSLTAYYVADAGIEAAIYFDRLSGAANPNYSATDCLDAPNNKICYEYTITTIEHPTEPLTKDMRIIQSKGSYKDIERAIELNYEINE